MNETCRICGRANDMKLVTTRRFISVALFLKSPSAGVTRYPCPVEPGLSSPDSLSACRRDCLFSSPNYCNGWEHFLSTRKILPTTFGRKILPVGPSFAGICGDLQRVC